MGRTVPTWTIDGFTLSGEAPYHLTADEYDDNGWATIVLKETGWISGAKPRTNRTPRAGAPGAFRGASQRDERIITLEGKTWTRTPEDRERAELALAGLCADGNRLYEFTRTTDTVQQTVYVELDDQPIVEMDNLNQVSWSFQFCAPDPRKFDTNWQQPITHLPTGRGIGLLFALDFEDGLDFGGSADESGALVGNRGTATSYPLFLVRGPVVNPVMVESATGATLTFTGALEASDVLAINCDYETQRGYPGHGVFLNNARRRGQLTLSGDWPEVPAGEVAHYQFRADDYNEFATMQVWLRSTWL